MVEDPRLLQLNLNKFLQNSQLIFRCIQAFFNSTSYHQEKTIDKAVSIIALNEVDALASTFMLQDYLTLTLDLQCDFCVVRCHTELMAVYKSMRYLRPQVSCFIFINIGNRQNLTRLLLSEAHKPVQWIILDYHRPICNSYLLDMGERIANSSDMQMSCSTFLPKEEMDALEEQVRVTPPVSREVSEPTLGGSPRKGILRTVVGSDAGEYYSCPTALMIYRALRDLDSVSVKNLLATGISLGFHLLNYSIAQENYNEDMRDLNKDLKELKRRFWRHSLAVHKMGYEDREVALPLLRFTSLQESIQMSPLFLACRVMEQGGARETDLELGGFRLELEVDKTAWRERTNPALLKALRLKLPETLKKFCGSRRVPNIESEVTSPVLYVSLKEKSLPDKLTTVDLAMLLGHYVCNNDFESLNPWLRSVYMNQMFQQGLRLMEWLASETHWNACQLIMSLVTDAFNANRVIERVVTRLLSRRASAIRRASDDIGGQRGILEGYLEEACPVHSHFSLRRICGSLSLAGAHQHRRPQIVLVTTPPLGSQGVSHVVGFRDRTEQLVTNQLGFMIAKFARAICGITNIRQDYAESIYIEVPSAVEARKLFAVLFPRRKRQLNHRDNAHAEPPRKMASAGSSRTIPGTDEKMQKRESEKGAEFSDAQGRTELKSTLLERGECRIEDLLYQEGENGNRKRRSPAASEAGSSDGALAAKKKRLDKTSLS